MTRALYDSIGIGYSGLRRPDPRIEAHLRDALGSARSVINVGAGAGSYEPDDLDVIAVEPSTEMIRQRAPSAPPAIRAVAEALPLRDASADAAMAVLTIHHWSDWRRGLMEMRRVARDRVVALTFDPDHEGFWLTRNYFPEIATVDRGFFAPISDVAEVLGSVEVRVVPVPHDCMDGFLGAYWRRPERYLEPRIRRAISAFSMIGDLERGLGRLGDDLRSGAWTEKNRAITGLTELDLGYRIVVGPGGGSA